MKLAAALSLTFCVTISSQPQTHNRCIIEGTVVNAATGAALSEAHVTLSGPELADSPSVTTNLAGQFCFYQLEPARYQARATLKGYVPGAYGTRNPDETPSWISLQSASDAIVAPISLWPESTLTGTVVDEDESPIANADVQVYQRIYSRQRKQLLPVWTGTADSNAVFTASGLAPGRYFLAAVRRAASDKKMPEGPKGADARADEAYTTSFYPGTPDPSGAAPIDIIPGAHFHGAKIRVKRLPSVSVRGKVINTVSNRAAGSTNVMLVPYHSGDVIALDQKSVGVAADGTFEITRVVPGSYKLIAIWKAGKVRYTGVQDVEVGRSDAEGIRVTIAPGADITGVVRVEGEGETAFGSMHVSLVDRETREMVAANQTDQSRRIYLSNVPPGNYLLKVTGLRENLYLKSVTIGSQDILGSDFVITGNDPGALTIGVSANGAEISGLVTNDSNRATRASILLVPENRESVKGDSPCQVSGTDQAGTFRLRGIAPGSYVAIAVDRAQSDACDNPEFLQRILSAGVRVKLEERGQTALRLKYVTAE
jgi:hypothetical protein